MASLRCLTFTSSVSEGPEEAQAEQGKRRGLRHPRVRPRVRSRVRDGSANATDDERT